ncbi:MAG TPA: hypothetical protein VM100_06980 [Longimicrobiales bacterium]|nr:hypothetical protein [Longimicrobiales bacterium]
MATNLTFLLSPASTAGRRAQLLFNERAEFDLARQLRTKRGAPLGDVFSFLSGLYFRGKLAYARAFAPKRSIFVITSNRGLQSPDLRITIDDLRTFASIPIDAANATYREPLLRHARVLQGKVVLLGSVASGKYVDVLLDVFDENLLFPAEFVGRGDMSRGGLLLRCVDDKRELTYVPVRGATRHGKRPPKLEKR